MVDLGVFILTVAGIDMQTSPGFRGLRVYQLAFRLAMEIFETTKAFPPEEKYSLTDQIRRSSRSESACAAMSFLGVSSARAAEANNPNATNVKKYMIERHRCDESLIFNDNVFALHRMSNPSRCECTV